jgi:hypothetical protein
MRTELTLTVAMAGVALAWVLRTALGGQHGLGPIGICYAALALSFGILWVTRVELGRVSLCSTHQKISNATWRLGRTRLRDPNDGA